MKTVEPVIPECEIDTALIETLVKPQSRYNHQYGCNNVAKAMQEKYSDKFVIGIIDKDKKRTKYLEEFVLEKNVDEHLELWKHGTKHHYLILICPAAEQWILNRSVESGIDLQNHSLPNALDDLCKVTKSIVSQKDARVVSLLSDLKKSNNPVVDTLIDWVTQLKRDQFKVDLTALK